MNRYNIRNQIIRDVADNECFISFIDDSLSYAFDEWINTEGMKAFYEWVRKSEYWSKEVVLED